MAQAALNETIPEAPPTPDAPPVKMVPIRLHRHYRPRDGFEVVGWHRPEKSIKRPDGQMMVVEKAEFVTEVDEDEGSETYGKIKPAPSPLPGAGTGGKIWASTVIRVPVAEAKTMQKAGIGAVEIED